MSEAMELTKHAGSLARRYGQVAYEAYCKSTGGRSLISGDLLPEFQALKPEIQRAWDEAAAAVIDDYVSILPQSEV